MIQGIYSLTLRAPSGEEHETLAWFPTPECRKDFYEKVRKRGLEVIENNNEDD